MHSLCLPAPDLEPFLQWSVAKAPWNWSSPPNLASQSSVLNHGDYTYNHAETAFFFLYSHLSLINFNSASHFTWLDTVGSSKFGICTISRNKIQPPPFFLAKKSSESDLTFLARISELLSNKCLRQRIWLNALLICLTIMSSGQRRSRKVYGRQLALSHECTLWTTTHVVAMAKCKYEHRYEVCNSKTSRGGHASNSIISKTWENGVCQCQCHADDSTSVSEPRLHQL